MDQYTFNYWYYKYVESYGIPAPSYDHLQQYIQACVTPYYIPPQVGMYPPMQMFQVPTVMQVPTVAQVPTIESIESSENSNNLILNKKYGLQTKDDCSNGMKCTNVYCTYFHHPSADSAIFLQK